MAAAGRAQRPIALRVRARSTTGSQRAPVPAKPCSRTTVGGHRPPIYDRDADTYLLLRAFVDELARCGMRRRVHVARLALDAARPRARARGRAAARCSHVDERAAGFFALGVAKATRPPGGDGVHVSGTAAAHYLPGGHRGARGARAAASC